MVVSGCKHTLTYIFGENTTHWGGYYDYYKQDNSQCLDCASEPWSPRPKPIKIKDVNERPIRGITYLSQVVC